MSELTKVLFISTLIGCLAFSAISALLLNVLATVRTFERVASEETAPIPPYTYPFAWNKTTIWGQSSYGVAYGDVDGNGKMELVFTSLADIVLYNISEGSRKTIYEEIPYHLGVCCGDVDNDGRDEVVTTNDIRQVVLIDWTPEGWTNSTIIQSLAGAPMSICCSDVDQNGIIDIVVGTSGGIYLLNNNMGEWISTRISTSYAECIYCGDADGDGKIDIVASTHYGNSTEILRNTQSGWIKETIMVSDDCVYAVSGADVDGDGKTEVFSGCANGSVCLTEFSGNEWRTSVVWSLGLDMWESATPDTRAVIPYGISCGDVNNDGEIDVVVRFGLNWAPSTGRIYLLQKAFSSWNATYVGSVPTWWSNSLLCINLDADECLEIVSSTQGLDIFDAVSGVTIVGDVIFGGNKSYVISQQNGSLCNIVGSLIVEGNAQLIVRDINLNIDPTLYSKSNITVKDNGNLSITENATINAGSLINVLYFHRFLAYDNSVMNLSMKTETWDWELRCYDNSHVYLTDIEYGCDVIAYNSSSVTVSYSYIGWLVVFPNSTINLIESHVYYCGYVAYTYGLTVVENCTVSGDWQVAEIFNSNSSIDAVYYCIMAFNATVVISNSNAYFEPPSKITGMYIMDLYCHGNTAVVITKSNCTSGAYVSIYDDSTIYASNVTLTNAFKQDQRWNISGSRFGEIKNTGLIGWAYSLDVKVIDQNNQPLSGTTIYAYNATDNTQIYSPILLATSKTDGTSSLYLPCDGIYSLKTFSYGMQYENNGTSLYLTECMSIVLRTRALTGVDVSEFQCGPPLINWSKVHDSGVEFAYVRATLGDNRPPALIDKNFTINMMNAKEAGLLVGAYHVAYADRNNALDEAEFFLSVAGNYIKAGYLRPMLDLEQDILNNIMAEKGSEAGKLYLQSWVQVWASKVENETGQVPILYMGKYAAANYFNQSFRKYDLWIVDWTYNLTKPPLSIGIWEKWVFWQYSNNSHLDGITGFVDCDAFNGDMNLLRKTVLIRETIINHVVEVDGKVFRVITRSNSTVSNLVLDQSQIRFNISGDSGSVGYCNVTIPKSLMNCTTLDDWIVWVNGTQLFPPNLTITENATHTFIYFTCTFASSLQVTIKGTHVVPEFQPFFTLPIFMIATLLTVIVYKRKHQTL